MKYTEIEHPSHPNHLLILKSVQKPYYCNGCKELGFKPCYQCPYKSCNFHLHEECATAPSSAIHPFFKTCNFMFHKEAPATGSGMRSRFCDGCGKDVRGYIYQCLHEKAHDLHPCCLKLPHIIKGDYVELRLTNKVSMKCLKCNSKEISRGVNGWCYVSTCGQYCYHVACVKDLVLDNWREGYFNHQLSSDGGMESSSSIALQTMVPSQEIVLVNGGSLGRRNAIKVFDNGKSGSQDYYFCHFWRSNFWIRCSYRISFYHARLIYNHDFDADKSRQSQFLSLLLY